MPFEDVALMRSIPGLVIISPCDPTSLEPLLEQAHVSSGMCLYTDATEGRAENL